MSAAVVAVALDGSFGNGPRGGVWTGIDVPRRLMAAYPSAPSSGACVTSGTSTAVVASTATHTDVAAKPSPTPAANAASTSGARSSLIPSGARRENRRCGPGGAGARERRSQTRSARRAAATMLQCKVRRWIARRRFPQLHRLRRQRRVAAVLLQAHVRGWLSRLQLGAKAVAFRAAEYVLDG